MLEMPVNSIKIGNQKSLVMIIPHYYIIRKTGQNRETLDFTGVLADSFFLKINAQKYTIHNKKNEICVVKACKINGFKSFLKAIFSCWSQIILLQT